MYYDTQAAIAREGEPDIRERSSPIRSVRLYYDTQEARAREGEPDIREWSSPIYTVRSYVLHPAGN